MDGWTDGRLFDSSRALQYPQDFGVEVVKQAPTITTTTRQDGRFCEGPAFNIL